MLKYINKKLKFLLILFLVLATSPCKKSDEEPEVVRPVFTMTVGGPAGGPSRSFSGVAAAQKEIILSFRVGGQIIALDLKVGQKVKVNEVLSQLDPKDAELTVSQKQAALVDSDAKLQRAKADYERIRKLYEAGSTSASELDSALAQFRSAKANREAAQKDLELSQQQLNYTTLRSEVDGEIISVPAEVFETVQAGQEIARMVTGDEIKMEIGVPESIINYINKEMPATIRFESLPGETFQGKVSEVGRSPTEATTYPVKLLVINPDVRIRPGMVGEVTFKFISEGERIIVPASVVVGEGPERFVWIYDPTTQRVKKQLVTIGALEGSGLVIEKGLKAGDIIVTRGVHRVEEGMKVRPMEDEKVQ